MNSHSSIHKLHCKVLTQHLETSKEDCYKEDCSKEDCLHVPTSMHLSQKQSVSLHYGFIYNDLQHHTNNARCVGLKMLIT